MSRLCSLCSQLKFLDLPPFPDWLGFHHLPLSVELEVVPFIPKREEQTPANPEGKPLHGSLGIPHHSSFDALQDAVATCELCELIADSVLKVKAALSSAKNDPIYVYYDKAGPPKYEFFISARTEGQDGFLVWSQSERETEYYLLGAIGYCVDDNSDLKARFRGRPVLEDPLEPINFERLRTWFDDCLASHKSCQCSPSELPLRVLDIAEDVSNPDRIRLFVPEPGTKAAYATLSHCWGDSRHFSTTKETLKDRMTGFSIFELPQTLQDAILVSRELQVRYLWIDSLCILQDDGPDWERESAKMTSIYSNAYVGLAASRSASDADGFLGPRARRKYVPVPITTPVNPPTNEIEVSGTIKLFNINLAFAAGGYRWIEQRHEPLSTRAWALQERILSRRTFYFGTTQTSYKCATQFQTEDGFHSDARWFDVAESEDQERSLVLPGRKFRGSARWSEIVGLFSGLKLTRQSDKFPALSGLARLFKDRLQDEYVAGLWKRDVVQGLAYAFIGPQAVRPTPYRAPSWSWASMDGKAAVTELGGWQDLVEVVDAKVQVKGENPFGELSDAILVLNGILEPIRLSEEPEPDEDRMPHKRHVRMKTADGNPHGYYAVPDIGRQDRDVVTQWTSFALPLALEPAHLAAQKNRSNTHGVTFVLWVKPSDRVKGAYERIGVIYVGDELVMNRWTQMKARREVREITLV